MEWLPAVATVLTSLGVGTVIPALLKHVLAGLTGRARRRRSDLERAWLARDAEARKRRIVERHAGLLERLLMSAPCVDPETIPAWPSYEISRKRDDE